MIVDDSNLYILTMSAQLTNIICNINFIKINKNEVHAKNELHGLTLNLKKVLLGLHINIFMICNMYHPK